jgi:hypothetical protein
VVAAAKVMPDVAVPESVWAGIRAGIGERTPGRSDVVPITSRVPVKRYRTFGPLQMAAAAALFLAVGTGIGLRFRPRTVSIAPQPVTTGVVLTPASLTPRADVTYDRAIADLTVILDHNRANLDTATVRVLESSLARIDKAIADAQAALAADPQSAYLNDHLSRIKRKKLDLLRQGTSLARAS